MGEILGFKQLIPSIPQVALDNIDNISKVLVKKFVGNEISQIMSIENNVIIDAITINLFVTFLLEREGVKKALAILGI